ncbi:MAG: hypothetical protein WC657_06180 [Candidatus Paceibacterota bacterium]
MSNGKAIASVLSKQESKTDTLTKPQSSVISEHSSVRGMPEAIRAWLMSSLGASHASRSVSQGINSEQTTPAICGRQPQTLFRLSDLDSACLRMCQEYANTCPWSSETCADLGTTFSDPCDLGLTIAATSTDENGSGFTLPTVVASDAERSTAVSDKMKQNLSRTLRLWNEDGSQSYLGLGRVLRLILPTVTVNGNDNYKGASPTSGDGLTTKVKRLMIPTVVASEGKGTGHKRFVSSPDYRGAKCSEALRTCKDDPIYLNPCFGEWMLDWPIGWTELAPLATDRFQSWLRQHGIS